MATLDVQERAAGRAASPDLLVLCYHAASPDWESFLAIRPESLRRQVELLLRRGYRPATLSEALDRGASGRRFALTFDDGYRSNVRVALPVLERLGVPATVFVPTDLIDNEALFECLPDDQMPTDRDELRCMSWDEVRSLSAAGWEVGSHTCTHPHLTGVDGERRTDELVRSRRVCEDRLQLPCRTIAYPYGSYDEVVIAATEAAGYELAVTLESRLLAPIYGRGPLAIPREGIFRETGWVKYRLNVSRAVRRMRLAAWYRRLVGERLRNSE